MNTLILISLTLRCFCIPGSPYFYDSELDSVCLNIIKEGIKESFCPSNCLVVDERLNESEGQVVFVCFEGYSTRKYSIFTKGKTRVSLKTYSKDLTKETCREIIEEIVEGIRQKYEISTFSIYFTVDLRCNKTEFFKEELLNESVTLIRKCFQEVLAEESVAKYFPEKYSQYLLQFHRHNPDNGDVQVLELGDSKRIFLFFFDESFFTKLSKKLQPLIERHEQTMIDKLKSQLPVKDISKSDLFILYVLSKMNGNLTDGLSNKQVEFLLEIWEFMKNKKGFSTFFTELFNEKEDRDLEEEFNSIIQENDEEITRAGLSFLLQTDLIIPKGSAYMLVMNSIKSKQFRLSKTTNRFISRIFTVLVEQIDPLTGILLSEGCTDNTLRRRTFYSYEKFARRLVFTYVDYSSGSAPDEFYETLTSDCLEYMEKYKSKDYCVYKGGSEELFSEYSIVRNQDDTKGG